MKCFVVIIYYIVIYYGKLQGVLSCRDRPGKKVALEFTM
ncbi:hypothetical protein DCCM_4761 [Desulfocucumis palustris]|uniref:Uncharacterized protein n=1 Tax=Desulfocucumis palustris TaxID=1898651 RepID=A0A2L2XHN4_9FIRM|nr:hypothetical protein DCCM_4761 [Desulfocucumis palustris]